MARVERTLVRSRDDHKCRASGLGRLNAGRSILEHKTILDFLP